MRNTAIRLTRDILIARRNHNIKQESRAHERFTNFCMANDLDWNSTFNGAARIVEQDVAAIMQGWHR